MPHTQKKCRYVNTVQTDYEEVQNGLLGAAAASESLAMDQVDPRGQWIQKETLAQLKKMSDRLNTIEEQITATLQRPGMASTLSSGPGKLSRDTIFSDCSKSTPGKRSRKSKKFTSLPVSNELSSDESGSPSLSMLRSQSMQKKVDKRINELNCSSHLPGNKSLGKHKSKRGGNVGKTVKNKVCWPHEAI